MQILRRTPRRLLTLLFVVSMLTSSAVVAFADGTETLGAPSIPIAAGSGTVAAGVGLDDTGVGTLSINVPGVAVNQALLYWEGQVAAGDAAQALAKGDSQILVDGNPVDGQLIGGPTLFFGATWSMTFRADVTALVAIGANSFDISGLTFDRHNNGAGMLVIYDDGVTAADIGVFDGNDLAFIGFGPTLDTTVPQTFNFAAEPIDRVSTMTVFASSVAESTVPGLRPTVIEVTLSNGDVIEFNNALDGIDGNQWDTFSTPIPIPAGVNSLTVQALSEDRLGLGLLPASFAWSGAALAVPMTPDDGGGAGCTPGYWKQEQHFDSWAATGLSPADDFDTVFGVASGNGWTLLDALEAKGGGEKALARHAVAALLNALSPGVDYEFSAAEVIAGVQSAYANDDFEGVKDLFEEQNELGCTLD